MVHDPNQLRDEVAALSDEYNVAINRELRGIVLQNYVYPTGWKPRTGPLMLRVTQYYPHHQPGAYIPEWLEYTGGRVTHLLHTDLEGWDWWCIHELDWDPTHHDLETMLDLLEDSFNHPAESNPIQTHITS